ncbi:MAG: hemolysin III family protein [Nitrospirota bacterium]|nr:hemolysin III family protein [Nitrospirota bacterium]
MYHGERFNTVTAIVGASAAAVGMAVLLVMAVHQGDPWKIVSFGVYGTTLLLLYGFSSLYHGVRGKHKRLLRRLDRMSIYLLIAGTYTPFTVITLRGPVGWSIFGVIWGLALIGMILDTSREQRRGLLPVLVYLLMGWLCVAAIRPLLHALPTAGFLWLLAGGLCYSVGVVFFLLGHRIRHFHGTWHLFVLAGSVCHYVAVFRYLL